MIAVAEWQAGVYDMSDSAYHADPVPGGSLSSTGARQLLPPSCPARYRYLRDHPEEKATLDLGKAAHLFVLGAGADVVKIDAADYRTKAAKDARDEARAAGKIPLLTAEIAQVSDMAWALDRHPIAAALLRPGSGRAEQSLFWVDATYPVWCRARIDWLPDPVSGARMIVTDYKTCRSADPRAIARSVADYGYHQQADWYLTGIQALGLAENPAFVFVFQEKTPPYLVTVAEPNFEALEIGAALNRRALEIYRDCKDADIWPGYSDEVELISLPLWARAREDYL